GAPTYQGEMLLSHMDVLEQLFRIALNAEEPIHIRCRSIEILASIHDASFAYRLEPLLLEPTPQVVCAAVEALARMEAKTSSRRVLTLMDGSSDPSVTTNCLKFFSRLALDERSTVLSLLSSCDRLGASPDRGIQFMIAESLVRQAESHSDIVVPRLL